MPLLDNLVVTQPGNVFDAIKRGDALAFGFLV